MQRQRWHFGIAPESQSYCQCYGFVWESWAGIGKILLRLQISIKILLQIAVVVRHRIYIWFMLQNKVDNGRRFIKEQVLGKTLLELFLLYVNLATVLPVAIAILNAAVFSSQVNEKNCGNMFSTKQKPTLLCILKNIQHATITTCYFKGGLSKCLGYINM